MRGVVGVVVGLLVLGAWQLGGSPQAGTERARSHVSHGAGRSSATVHRPGRVRRATVVRIVDGDTLILRADRGAPGLPAGAETRVRLLEMDTPESVKPGTPVQCYARRAAAELALLTPLGTTVWTVADRQVLDPYGRTLLYVWNSHGTFVNLRLVRSGAARAVLYEPNDRYIDVLRAAEVRARHARVGLWGTCARFGAL